MSTIDVHEIVSIIEREIVEWHERNSDRPNDAVIVTDSIRRIRPLGQHRTDISLVVKELAATNLEMWHEEDKVRSSDDATVLRAIRNINPLNQHRNDLIEEIDEIFLEQATK